MTFSGLVSARLGLCLPGSGTSVPLALRTGRLKAAAEIVRTPPAEKDELDPVLPGRLYSEPVGGGASGVSRGVRKGVPFEPAVGTGEMRGGRLEMDLCACSLPSLLPVGDAGCGTASG